MTNIPNSVPVGGFFAPSSSLDEYPVTKPEYGLGGLRTIEASAGLTGIPQLRREEGMIVYAIDTQKYYHLFGGTGDEHWSELVFDSTIGLVGPTGATGPTGQGYINAEIRDNILFITEILPDGTTNELNLGYVGPTGNDFIFDENLTANFKEGKSFGRFLKGDFVETIGKSAVQLIKEAFSEPLEPSVSLSSSVSNIPFNQTSPTITLNFSYEIISQGAGASSADLEFRLSNSSSWSSLTSGTELTSFTHEPSLSSGNTQSLVYRYTVVDTEGASAFAQTSVLQTQYSPITFNFTQSKQVNSEIESLMGIASSVDLRERNNISTRLSRTPSSTDSIQINNNNQPSLVPITSWSIQRKINNDDWVSLTSQSDSFSTSPIEIPQIIDSPPDPPTPNTIRYRIFASDAFNGATATLSPIEVFSPIFFGGTSGSFSSIVATGSDIRNFVINQGRQIGAVQPPEIGKIYMEEFVGDRTLFVALPTDIVMTSAINIDNFNQSYFSGQEGFVEFLEIQDIPLYNNYKRDYTIYTLSASLGASPTNSISDTIEILITGNSSPQ